MVAQSMTAEAESKGNSTVKPLSFACDEGHLVIVSHQLKTDSPVDVVKYIQLYIIVDHPSVLRWLRKSQMLKSWTVRVYIVLCALLYATAKLNQLGFNWTIVKLTMEIFE